MILYFSATGNSKHVAEKIAESTGDTIQSLLEVDAEIVLRPGENLGIVSPVYFQYLPTVVEDAMKGLRIKGDASNYLFTVLTYGTFSGQGNRHIARYLQPSGLQIRAEYSVKMADTWTATFDLSNREKVAGKVARGEEQLQMIIQKIQRREIGHFQKDKMPKFVADLMYKSYEEALKTEHLHVEESCIGCGLCERNCPVQAIAMKEGKPAWVKDRCAMCLQCLHKCPRFAIQYDNKTQKHGQYTHEMYQRR